MAGWEVGLLSHLPVLSLLPVLVPRAPEGSSPPSLWPAPSHTCPKSHLCHRVPEVADYTYWTVPRHCGGSHTLTHPQRRSRLQHLSQSLYPSEEVQIAMKVRRPLGRQGQWGRGP